MAAPISHVRLKLSIKNNANDKGQSTTLWYSIDFKKHEKVQTVVTELCNRFQTDVTLTNLYLQNVLIPSYETCSLIFRDNDEIELISSERKSLLTSIPSEPVDNNSDVVEVWSKNKRKRRVSLGHGQHQPDDTQSPKKKKKKKRRDKTEVIPVEENVGDTEHTLHQHADGAQSVVEGPVSSQAKIDRPTDEVYKAQKEEMRKKDKAKHEQEKTEQTEDSSESDDDDVVVTSVKKRDRSSQLTPIEQQLIKEMENLPKPKRIRKHKRKNSKKVENTDVKTDKIEPVLPEKVTLKCDFQGVKRVFESDGETEDKASAKSAEKEKIAEKTWEAVKLTTADRSHRESNITNSVSLRAESSLNNTFPTASKRQTTKADTCFSSIEVTPKNNKPAKHANSVESVIPVYSSIGPELVSSSSHQGPSSNQRKTKPPTQSKIMSNAKSPRITSSTNGSGPAVFKRERKLKLRATISPAIFDQLHKSQADESSVSQSLPAPDNNTTAAAAASPVVDTRQSHPTNYSTPLNGHRIDNVSASNDTGSTKKIRWHKQYQHTSMTPTFSMSREDQLNDHQTNISTIVTCDSPADKSAAYSGDVADDASAADNEREEELPAVDYSKYKVLEGPPREGDKLAFKRLTVSEDYTPVVSVYQLGQVVAYEPKSKMVHIKLISKSKKKDRRRKGVFDVHMECDDGETLTNVDEDPDQIVDVISSLMEPRLVTD